MHSGHVVELDMDGEFDSHVVSSPLDTARIFYSPGRMQTGWLAGCFLTKVLLLQKYYYYRVFVVFYSSCQYVGGLKCIMSPSTQQTDPHINHVDKYM